MPFRFPRFEIFKDEYYWKYGISFTAHGVKIKFLANSQEEAKKWYDRIRSYCNVVLVHLSKSYQIGNIISKGSNGKINKGVCKKTGKDVMIKTTPKQRLIDNRRSLVKL